MELGESPSEGSECCTIPFFFSGGRFSDLVGAARAYPGLLLVNTDVNANAGGLMVGRCVAGATMLLNEAPLCQRMNAGTEGQA
jgi:hypothetical protein